MHKQLHTNNRGRMIPRRVTLLGLALVMVGLLGIALLSWRTPMVQACPFCSSTNSKTFAEEIDECAFVLHGTFTNVQVGVPEGTTDLNVMTVIKDHEKVAGRKVVVIPKELPALADPKKSTPPEFIMFGQIINEQIVPVRIIEVNDKDLVPYFVESAKQWKSKQSDKLGFFFNYLDHRNDEIANDAYKVFAVSPFADVKQAAKYYDTARLLKWLQGREQQSYKIGLFACLLGVAGKKEDGDVLKKMVLTKELRPLTGIDGLIGGYCMLNPDDGAKLLVECMTGKGQDFNTRYSTLRAIRVLLSEVSVIDRKVLIDALGQALDQPDICDLIIDELRTQSAWNFTDKIVKRFDTKPFDAPIVQRAVLRYSLRSPDKAAADLVTTLRQKNPDMVKDAEEILRFEDQLKAQQNKPAEKSADKPADKKSAS